MSNDALIADLSANLHPVRRRSILRETASLCGLGALELLLVLRLGSMRPDMARMMSTVYMWWKLSGLALLVAVSGTTAIRSLSPTVSPRRGLATFAALAGVTVMAGAVLHPGTGVGATVLERLAPAHGIICSAAIVILSLPMLAIMAVLMRRNAPVHHRTSALAAGVAAGTWGALIFALCCPANDPLYVVVWYLLGCGVVAVLGRSLLLHRFRL